MSNTTSDYKQQVMDKLLELYDFHIRTIDVKDSEYEYDCGYTDAVGQCILDIGDVFGCSKWDVEKQKFVTGYKYEAYKRVMETETVKKYKQDYPA